MDIKTSIGQYRMTALIEGISYLLLAITVPLKYWLEMGLPNKIVGMAHGVLFIAFVILTFINARERNWSPKFIGLCLLASVLPFGTFWLDAKHLKHLPAKV